MPVRINVPSMVAIALKDLLHNHYEGAETARQVKGSYCLDMADNRRTHNADMVLGINKFISSRARRQFQEDLLSQDIS